MRVDLSDPYTIGEALASQVVRLSYCVRDNTPVDAASAEIIRNISTAAQNALEAGRKCLENGETEAALWSIGAAEGAISLITGLLAAPDDSFIQEMAAPFTPVDTEANQ